MEVSHMGLVVHAGGRVVTRDDLALVEVPPATDSYSPVPHERLADTLSTIGRDILKGFALEKEQYALAREGKQMFGVLVFQNDSTELGLSIGFRNSYDKSMAIGIAIGASVFVCDNLALTVDVWASLEDTAISTLYRSQKNFESITTDAEELKRREIGDDEAFRLIGL